MKGFADRLAWVNQFASQVKSLTDADGLVKFEVESIPAAKGSAGATSTLEIKILSDSSKDPKRTSEAKSKNLLSDLPKRQELLTTILADLDAKQKSGKISKMTTVITTSDRDLGSEIEVKIKLELRS